MLPSPSVGIKGFGATGVDEIGTAHGRTNGSRGDRIRDMDVFNNFPISKSDEWPRRETPRIRIVR